MAAFAAGQKWKYKTRPQDSGSTVTILKVEQVRGQSMVHVSIDGVEVRNPQAPDGVSKTVGHVPMDAGAFKRSVTEMVSSDVEISDAMLDGYYEWKRASDAGKGGAFIVPLSEVVEHIEKSVNRSSAKRGQ